MATEKLESAPSAKRVEAWVVAADECSICAPPPPKKVIEYHWDDPTEEDPDNKIVVKVKLTASVDTFDPSIPEHAAAFDWDTESAAAKAHIATYVHRGTGETDDIVLRRSEGCLRIIAGRHRVLYARIANQIRKALGKGECLLRAASKKIDDDRVSTAIVVSNIRHRRAPIDDGREWAKVCADRNITPEMFAKEFGLPKSTVRRRIALAEKSDPKAMPRETRVRSGLKKPQQKALFEALKKQNDLPDEALQIAEAIYTGVLPTDATRAVRKAWEAVQS